ncbi:MAG: P-loop NTPase fold protein [Patescibacteria group bacterium]
MNQPDNKTIEGEGTRQEPLIKSRTYFVREVAETIIANHGGQSGEDEGSFIFGISGKWGEGKTTFLRELASEVKSIDDNFEIKKLSPWKFGMDKVAFLRNFLSLIGEIVYEEDQSSNPTAEDRGLSFRERFRHLYYDLSETEVKFERLLGVVVTAFVFLVLVYSIISNAPDAIKWALGFISIPTILAVLVKTAEVKVSDAAVSTLDKFDDALEELLRENNRMGSHRKKILILLDDLDRVTPDVARRVLDNLRTFFDREEISFVVTGDHSVLENHLGRELKPDADRTVQEDEGRRFLKKIFDVNWRMPLPTKEEMENFIRKELSEPERKHLADFLSEEQLGVLVNYLKDYFDSNLRGIIRFMDMLLFNFRVIDAKLRTQPEDKEGTQAIKDHPLLFIRIRMIQELCAPLFEEFIKDDALVEQLDRAIDRRNQSLADSILDKVKRSSSQEEFIKAFLPRGERFVQNDNMVVPNAGIFVHLAADPGTVDSRGPSSEGFLERISSNDPDEVAKTLTIAQKSKLKNVAKAFNERLNETSSGSEKVKFLETLLGGLSQLDPQHAAQATFAETLHAVDEESLGSLSTEERVPLLLAFWRWLDLIHREKEDELKDYYENLAPTSLEEINQIIVADTTEAGSFTSRVLTDWLVNYYEQNPQDAISRMNDLLPKLDSKIAGERIKPIADSLLSSIMAESNEESRDKKIRVLRYTPNSPSQLKTQVAGQLKKLNESVWSWSSAKSNEDKPMWSRKDLEDSIIEGIEGVENGQFSLEQVMRFSAGKISTGIEAFWGVVLRKFSEDLPTVFLNTVGEEPHYKPLAPDAVSAETIFSMLVKVAKADTEVENKVQNIDLLKRDRWFWGNMESIPSKSKMVLVGMRTTKDERVSSAVSDVISSWG